MLTWRARPNCRSGVSPAGLIQGQRDFFGAHTYRRVDKPGTFHTERSDDRSETTIDGGEARAFPPEPAEKADPTRD